MGEYDSTILNSIETIILGSAPGLMGTKVADLIGFGQLFL
jgi:hypothetical protein